MVIPVILFFNSGNVYPIANFAAIYANGYPVAFDANAEDLERRAFTSIARNSLEKGSNPYCILHSPIIPRFLKLMLFF